MELIELLQNAKKDPALRPEFYKALWEAELYFVGRVEETDGNSNLYFYEACGKTLMPCFSSEELFRSVVPEHEPVVALHVSDVFPNIGSEITVVLNPFTDSGKEFDSLERRALAEGMLFKLPPSDEPEPTAEPETTYFGTPKEKPEALLAALNAFFQERPQIQTAYLGMIYTASTGLPPHPLVGLVWTGTSESAFLELTLDLQAHIRESVPETPHLDVYRLTPDADNLSEIARYLLDQTTPIYTREP